MIITSTPMRISFFGGGTDYPIWYREHGGSVLSTTIDKVLFYNLPMASALFRISQPHFLYQS